MDGLAKLPAVRIEADGARVRTLCNSRAYRAALVYYPAEIHHPDHEHDDAAFTFLLNGGFLDAWEGRESTPSGSRHGYRPQGARHACRFGPNGALILSVVPGDPSGLRFDPHQWWPSGTALAELYRLLFARAAPAEAVIDDLLAVAGAESEQGRKWLSNPPRWLRHAADEIRDDPTVEIAAVAERSGVHRVYLARAFRAHFGLSPTLYRLQCKAAVATRHLIQCGETTGMAAIAAGFADQAHWTRTSRALAGVTPGRLRGLLVA